MKQSDRIIRKGDYYEMQVVEDGFYSSKITKKQQSQSNIQQANQNIITQLPSFGNARANYYLEPTKAYSNAGPDELLHELEDILREERITDEDKQQVLKLIKQVKILKEEPLGELPSRSGPKIKEKQEAPFRKIELRSRLDLKNIEDKVAELEKFSYPQISKLEHQLEILLGEKKSAHNISLPKDDRNKEDIQNLFATFNSISFINNFQGLVNKVHANNAKYVEIANWTTNIEDTIAFHADFEAELRQDEQLLNKLEEGFKENVAKVRAVIAEVKKQAAK